MESGGILSASVPIELDGRELQLRYRAYALIRYAEIVGGDLLRDLSALGQKMQALDGANNGMGESWATLRDILWAGLVDAQPELSRDEVSRLFGIADLPALMPAIMQAIEKTMPKSAEEKARPMKARRETRAGGLASGPIIASETASPPPNSGA